MNNDVFENIRRWGVDTFPNANAEGILEHLKEEVQELLDNPTDVYEMADIVILLTQLAALLDIKLERAVEHKLDVNKRRTWHPPDSSGVVRHKKEVQE